MFDFDWFFWSFLWVQFFESVGIGFKNYGELSLECLMQIILERYLFLKKIDFNNVKNYFIY